MSITSGIIAMEALDLYDYVHLDEIIRMCGCTENELKFFLESNNVPIYWRFRNKDFPNFKVSLICFVGSHNIWLDLCKEVSCNGMFKNALFFQRIQEWVDEEFLENLKKSNSYFIQIPHNISIEIIKFKSLINFCTSVGQYKSKLEKSILRNWTNHDIEESQYFNALDDKKITCPIFQELFFQNGQGKYEKPLQKHDVPEDIKEKVFFSIYSNDDCSNLFFNKEIDIEFKDIYIHTNNFELFKESLNNTQIHFNGNEPYFSPTIRILLKLAYSNGQCIPTIRGTYPSKEELHQFLCQEINDQLTTCSPKIKTKIMGTLISLLKNRNHINSNEESIFITDKLLSLCVALREEYKPIFDYSDDEDPNVVAKNLAKILKKYPNLKKPPKNKDIKNILIQCKIFNSSANAIPSFLPPLLMTFRTQDIKTVNNKD